MLNILLVLAKKFKIIIKFLISGGTATAVDLLFLYIFTDIFGIYYLVSTVIAFVLAFFVSFYLQKFWTFRDKGLDRIYKQLSQYITVTTVNLALNTLGMYILVEKYGIMYLLAQLFVGAFIAIISFMVYRFVIFKDPKGAGIDLAAKID